MAGNISNYLENKLLDHSLGTASYTMPTVYLALHTADPTDTGGGAEVSGTAYARQAVSFSAAASGATSNSGNITFPAAGSNWGTVTHIGIWDALTTGNLLWHGSLTASQSVNTGNVFQINTGDLDVSLD